MYFRIKLGPGPVARIAANLLVFTPQKSGMGVDIVVSAYHDEDDCEFVMFPDSSPCSFRNSQFLWGVNILLSALGFKLGCDTQL